VYILFANMASLDMTNMRRQLNQVNDDVARIPNDLADTDDEYEDKEEGVEHEADPMDDGDASYDSEGDTSEEDDTASISVSTEESNGIRFEEDDGTDDGMDEDADDETGEFQGGSRGKNADNMALAEIRRLQGTTDYLIPFAAFNRLVRQIALDYKTDLRFTKNAILALQSATEDGLINLFDQAQVMALHSGRIGITSKDLTLACRGKGNDAFNN
jgi:histone H3/H4